MSRSFSAVIPSFSGTARAALAAPLLILVLGGQADVRQPADRPGSGRLEAIAAADATPLPARIAIRSNGGEAGAFAASLVETVEETVQRALAAREIAVVETGAPVLRFTLWFAPHGGPTGARDRPVPPIAPTIGPRDRPIEAEEQVVVPLGRRTGAPRSSLAISFVLFEPGREPSWSASIDAFGTIPDPADMARRLTVAAMDVLGASARQTFLLNCVDGTESKDGHCLP